jgi:hypothetical protein
MRRLLPILAILFASGSTAAAAIAERPLFETGSEYAERPRQRQVRPNAELVRLVLSARSYDMAADLDPCVAEYRLRPRDYASLMYAVPIPSGPRRTLWFVRGSLNRFCLGLYGAHSFSYFLIDQRAGRQPRYRLVFDGGGDYLAIYRTRHNGLNDIQPEGCIATGCSGARMVFDGRHYRASWCILTTWDANHREVRRRVRCPRDG